MLKNNFKYRGLSKADTVYFENGAINAVGNIAFSRKGRPYSLKVGLWKEYYKSGELKSVGFYNYGSFVDCDIAGPETNFYNFKSGEWIYFHPNTEIKAKGEYDIIKATINTRCGGDKLKYGITTQKWKFKTDEGNEYQPTQTELREYESVPDSLERFKVGTYYDRKSGKVWIDLKL